MLALFLGAIIFGFIFVYAYKRKKLTEILPPGPPGLPMVGNLLEFDGDIRKTVLKWHNQYGPMFTVWMGMKPEVFVTGYHLMHELFVKRGDEFADRPDDFVLESATGKNGIINISGDKLREQRRFTLQVLRNFGFGRKIMEEKVTNEVEKFVKAIQNRLNGSRNKVVCLKEDLQLCVGNIISSVIVGRTYETNDPTFDRLKYYINKSFQTGSRALVLLLDTFPWLRFVPLFGHFGYDDTVFEWQQVLEICKEEVDKHKKEVEETIEANDFTAAYIKEMQKRSETGQNMSYFDEWQLVSIMGDLWAAGLETTVTTMEWAILLMMKHPEIQSKVQKELDTVLGFERQPTLADKANLPYVSAVLQEVQRFANIVPVNFGRKIAKDTLVNGYLLPAGTKLVPQISTVHLDDNIYPRPFDFNPDRFLESDGKTLKKCDELVPFSLGKRSCLGESLARLELFIIFTYLLQKFNFKIDPNHEEPSLEAVMNFTAATKPYECLISERF